MLGIVSAFDDVAARAAAALRIAVFAVSILVITANAAMFGSRGSATRWP